ncbi:hypothetical protein [Foetidibacter luteolus]|uniref:hypothetical protein n=1 Tax=Foetidibacter luteolus TaxID=2608880 RepID=UPI00129A2087|nr:hypothetical protein [Foetidibacter luteolus]
MSETTGNNTGNGLSAESGISSDTSGNTRVKNIADEIKQAGESTTTEKDNSDKNEAECPAKGLIDEPGEDKIVLSGGSGVIIESPVKNEEG